jgi:hypothetical protein
MRVDLHVHTCYSKDSLTPLEAIIGACFRRGIGKIAITDHNTILGAIELREMVPNLVIVGEEVDTTKGEIIGLFLEEEIPKGLPPEEAIARIREQGGLVYVPHPLDWFRRSALGKRELSDFIEEIDIIEVFNARTLFPWNNWRAERLARERGLLCGAGSDAHTAYEVGRAYVEIPPFNSKGEFLEGLAQGRVAGRLTIPLIHLAAVWAKIRKISSI